MPQRPRPRPRGAPPPRRLPPIPPAFVGQQVSSSFGDSFGAIMQAIALLAGDAQGSGVDVFNTTLPVKGRPFRIPASPNAGAVTWQVDADMIITAVWVNPVSGDMGFSTSGMTIANWNHVDDGGILFMGTWSVVNNPITFNWRINRGQTL